MVTPYRTPGERPEYPDPPTPPLFLEDTITSGVTRGDVGLMVTAVMLAITLAFIALYWWAFA